MREASHDIHRGIARIVSTALSCADNIATPRPLSFLRFVCFLERMGRRLTPVLLAYTQSARFLFGLRHVFVPPLAFNNRKTGACCLRA